MNPAIRVQFPAEPFFCKFDIYIKKGNKNKIKMGRFGKARRDGLFCCVLIEIVIGFILLCYWEYLRRSRVYNPSDVSTLSCGESFRGCCPVYSGCHNTSSDYLSDIHVRYVDIKVLDYDKTNCPSLYDILDHDKDIGPTGWRRRRPNYCSVDAACDEFTRMGTSDFRTYIRSVSVGMYMFGTDIPKSEGCNEERIIDSVVTNYNRRRYSQEISIYLYLSVFSFILVVPTLCCTYIEATGKDCSGCPDCLPSHSNVKHVQLRGSA